jgi:hypothetical protein
MRPRERRETSEQDLFHSRLDQIIHASGDAINAVLAAAGYSFRASSHG